MTPRELEVLRLIADGKTGAEIGRELWIEETTVKYHVDKILQKLGATNRAHAVAKAIRSGQIV